jgi:bifunctional aspartokinase / homoserine dehydrogenase 1
MTNNRNELIKNKPKKTLVMKFGGTSVGTSSAMGQTVQIIEGVKKDWDQIVVITSALSGITNWLLKGAQKSAQGDMHSIYQAETEIRRAHEQIADELISDQVKRIQIKQEISHLISDFINLCQAVAVLGEATPRALDAVSSLGERMSVRLLAAAMENQGIASQVVESTQLIVTDTCFQNAHPDFKTTMKVAPQVINAVFEAGRIPVVTGFIGSTPGGVVTTLGRGGSDYSAGILAKVLEADEVWIWTDVDGVMSADPRRVPNARTIAKLSYREIAELAYFGAKVLHPKTIRPIVEEGIELRICNTFNADHPGTRLVPDNAIEENGALKAVTMIDNQKMITVEGRGMLGVPGVAARAFAAVASTGTSVPIIIQASSEQSISFAVPMETADNVINALENTFKNEIFIRDIDCISASDPVVIITVVGAGILHTPGVAGKIFSALGKNHVNVIAIAQGSSTVSISLVVSQADADKGLLSLHEIILGE